MTSMDMSSSMKIILKSVGMGFTINRMKYHPTNDGLLGKFLKFTLTNHIFIAVYGNKD